MFPPRVRHIFRAMTAKFWWVSLLVLALALHFQSAPFVKDSWPKRLESIADSGTLRVLVPNAPETFHSATVDFREFDRALSNAFAERLGLSVDFVEVEPGPPMLRALRKGEADLAVGTPLGVEAPVTLSTPILDYQLQLIRHRDTPKLKFSEDLSFQLVVASNSEESQALAALASHQPNLKWVETTDLNREEILVRQTDHHTVIPYRFSQSSGALPELTVDALGEFSPLAGHSRNCRPGAWSMPPIPSSQRSKP